MGFINRKQDTVIYCTDQRRKVKFSRDRENMQCPLPSLRGSVILLAFQSQVIDFFIPAGAHNYERAATPNSSQGVFIDRSILSLILMRIQTPARTSVTNRKHGFVMLRARVTKTGTDLFCGKRSLKTDQSVKIP